MEDHLCLAASDVIRDVITKLCIGECGELAEPTAA